MVPLDNLVAIITGSSRGIGSAIAVELARNGVKVVLNYVKSKEHAEALASQISNKERKNVIAVQADVSDVEQATMLVNKTINAFGRVDILVNNAGITLDKTVKKLSIEEWDKVIQVNLNSVFYTTRAVIPYFMEQRSGKIINISSFTAQTGHFGQANYTAAKAGIIAFTKTTALELARYNVTVNAICPGFIETDMFAQIPEEIKQGLLQKIPLGRPGSPDEIARAVHYLVVDGNYITGQTLNINGGIYM